MSNDHLPARLPSTEIMPIENHYLPARFWARRPGELFAVFLFFVIAIAMAFLGTPMWLSMVFAVVVGGGAGVSSWFRIHKGASDNIQGQMLMMSGRIDDAGRVFEDLCVRYPDHPHHALFVHNRAVTFISTGEVRRALAMLNAVHHSRRFETRILRPFKDHLEANRALCLALLGELKEADRILVEMEDPQSAAFGFTILPRAIILVRRGQNNEAYEIIVRNWRAVEGLGNARSIKGLRAVGGLAGGLCGKTDEAEKLLAGLFPMSEGDLDWIGVEWPEFRRFAVDRGLVRGRN
jgi:hypothetical protein